MVRATIGVTDLVKQRFVKYKLAYMKRIGEQLSDGEVLDHLIEVVERKGL